MTARRRNIAVTIHIVAALALLGVSTVVLAAGIHAATGDDARDAHAVYELLRLLTFSLDLPLAVLTLVSGVRLALTSSWGLFRHWWVIAKLAIYGTTLVIGLALIGPSIETLRDVTEAGSPGESGARSTLIAAAGVQVVILVGAATLGVFKPGGPRRTRPQMLHAGAEAAVRASCEPRSSPAQRPDVPRQGGTGYPRRIT
jgi:uncharacterized membrane protein